MKIYAINGTICEESEAKIPVTDHGFLYGDGVFEGLRYYGNRILKLRAHMDRLADSAAALSLTLPMMPADIETSLKEVVNKSAFDNGYLRLIVTRGPGPLGIDPSNCEQGNVVIIGDQLKMISDEVRALGAKLIISSTRRLAGDQLDSRIKSLNYLNQIMARIEANAAGADEAIVLNQNGFIAEGTADNLFIVKNGVLKTPPATDGALEGVTRAIILDISKSLGLEVKECSLTTYDVFTADECFLTGTGAELIPVREVASRNIAQSPGPVFTSIEQSFQNALAGDALFADG